MTENSGLLHDYMIFMLHNYLNLTLKDNLITFLKACLFYFEY